jgi:hypothetical protein
MSEYSDLIKRLRNVDDEHDLFVLRDRCVWAADVLEARDAACGHDIVIPDYVRALNRIRCDRWHPPTGDDWTLGDWSNAFMGEGGELANVVKKLRRHQSGHATSYNTPEVVELRERFAEEVADVLLYLDLLCWKAGVEPAALLDALIDKFDKVSLAQGWSDLTIEATE